MNVRNLISILSDGEFHSGSEIGAMLNVSRTAVWKALAHVQDYGLEVESIKGKGYRLQESVDLLDESEIRNAISSQPSDLYSLSVHMSLDSTNQYVLDNEDQSAAYQFVLSERQVSGRGRRGRSWVSPFGQNIYMSAGFDVQGGVEALSGLSLVVGVAAVRAIKSCSTADVKLKWPNDVWLDGKKLAGILVELRGEATTAWRVVAGIGVNVDMTQKASEDIDQPWCSLGPYMNCSRSHFAAKLMDNMMAALMQFEREGLPGFLAEWQELDCLYGNAVTVTGYQDAGVARGIDHAGALLVDFNGDLVAVNAGEVSVRPHES